MILIKAVKTPQELDACFKIREKVFVQEQHVAPEIELDEFDQSAFHFLALKDGQPVGTARVVLSDDGQTATIGRVAVLKEARGLGIGKSLMEAIDQAPDLQPITRFELHAQTHALAFYESLGYAAYGEDYLEADIPHRSMQKTKG